MSWSPTPATTTTAPTATAPPPATGPAPGPGGGLAGLAGLARLARDTWILTRRSLARIRNQPETLSDVTAQPVMFVLLFAYVFGSAINLGGPFNGTADYREYLIGGLFGFTAIGTMAGTAVGMTADMESGLVDRLRSLPISRAAVLAGRTVSDLFTNMIGLAVTAATGLAVGWRIHTGPADVLAAVGLVVLLSFAVSWAGVCLGMLFRSPEGAQGGGFLIFLPLMFVSNAFVPTDRMPVWLRTFANWNPVSAVAASCRNLFGNPNPASSVGAWPMQHPEVYAVLWALGIVVVFAPLAVHMFRRKAMR
jgi:ABC-2 type transport system permease protein